MTLTDWIKANEEPDPLTNDEFQAVYAYVNEHKDEWPDDLKEGMLKLLGAEEVNRL